MDKTRCYDCSFYDYFDYNTTPECMKMTTGQYKKMTETEKESCQMYMLWISRDAINIEEEEIPA